MSVRAIPTVFRLENSRRPGGIPRYNDLSTPIKDPFPTATETPPQAAAATGRRCRKRQFRCPSARMFRSDELFQEHPIETVIFSDSQLHSEKKVPGTPLSLCSPPRGITPQFNRMGAFTGACTMGARFQLRHCGSGICAVTVEGFSRAPMMSSHIVNATSPKRIGVAIIETRLRCCGENNPVELITM